ncbi:reverse transcriptase domain-containing protein [Staphylococcus kloosii]|uniref:reverse transcriptase domain-containing protein n=1 Tax=Staphylococcus kloosii TaxID=29384 RepID=UPI00189D6050|nr:reverse transcriptase domain-containing protein [Staphylococcus kloosii]MBF7020983.1 hypothetical protein [Staphylococcus kloosii]
MDKNFVLNLAFKYVISVAKSKPYNIQMRAILNEYSGELSDKKIYLKPYDGFKYIMRPILCKDFVYKSNLSTYRNFYIVSPSLYLYYTFQVFELYFDIIKDKQLFEYTNIDIYYSGLVNNEFKNVKENSNFNNQYELYKNEQASYNDNYVLLTDIQNFFDSINVDMLLKKCRKLITTSRGVNAIKNLENLFISVGIKTLPQLHYSIASSLLSQIYLNDLTNKTNQLLKENNWVGVRFVDDFCINLNKNNSYKYINKFLHEYSSLLYKNNLNLNANKTKRLTPKKFNELISNNLSNESYETIDISFEQHLKYIKPKFSVNDSIKNKGDDLINLSGMKFMDFVYDIKKIYIKYGLDIEKYNKKVKTYFSINNEDAQKVINHFIFSKLWQKLSELDLKEILACKELVFFDPIKFTTLYCLINSYIGNHKYKIFNEFDGFYPSSIRSLIIFEQLTIQTYISKKEFSDIKDRFREIDPYSINFFEQYIFL